uniref:Era-like 12S mitochondrial rRNA chaperone 1 n=1 Tax=Cyprinus carpio TaxID=7962 RepID=A0A8C2HRF9_CYPCA
MTLRLCETILRRSLRFSAILKLTAALEHAPLHLHLSGCSVFGPQTGKCLFHCTPASLVSSGAFLDRLQKGRAVLSSVSLMPKDPDQPENAKSLKVTIVAAPNAGKSTLTNQLLGRKKFAVSEKVHTTRSRAVGVLTQDGTQICGKNTNELNFVLLYLFTRHHLEEPLLVDPFESIKEADLGKIKKSLCFSCSFLLDYEVLKCLALNPDVPAILVLNLLKNKTLLLDITAQLTEGVVNGKKIRIRGAEKPHQKSAVKPHSRYTEEPHSESMKDGASQEGQDKDRLSPEELTALKSRRGWPLFKDVSMLRSVHREDVETLKPGQWQYHSEVLTDQGPEEVCISTISEKLLQCLPKEVPHSMTQQIEIWKESEDGVLDISIKLHVKKELSDSISEAENDLMKIFLREVRLKISAKLRK